MAGGEVCFRVFNRVSQELSRATRLDVPAFFEKECCFQLPVLAEVLGEGDDVYKNDKHNVLRKYDSNLFTDVVIFLEKYDTTNPLQVDGWYEAEDLSVEALGTYYPYGSVGMSFSDGTKNYVSSTIDWQVVMYFHGEGTYRFKFKETNFTGNITYSYYFFEFCLKKYLPYRADRTTRFTTYTKGYRGDSFIDNDIWDYTNLAQLIGGEGWFQQMRFPNSFFGSNKSAYEREYIKYQNGQQVYLKDEQVENYTWNSGHYPSELHNFIKTDILQSDRILVTDYNSNNPNVFNDKAVHPNSNYEPKWNYNNLKAFVDVDFTQEFQNRRKKRC